MKRLRRRPTATPSDKSKPRMRFSKWKRAAAALIIEAVLLTPLSCATVSDRRVDSQTVKALTFEDAKKDQNLRQAYLDSKAEEWGSECVAAIIYDPEGKKLNEEHRRLHSKYGNDPSTYPENLSYDETSGVVIVLFGAIGRKQKMNIYVLPYAFHLDEEHIHDAIPVHEGTHACDVYHGIRAGKRTFTHKELQYIDPNVTGNIIEVRAIGNTLRQITPERWEDPKTWPELVNQIGRLNFYLTALQLYEKFLPKKIKDKDLKNEAYLVRATLAEYKDLAEKLDAFIEKKRKGL